MNNTQTARDKQENAQIRELLEVIEDLERSAEMLAAENERLRKDKARLDWLADPENNIGNVQLPERCVRENLHDIRAAIDSAMDYHQREKHD